MAQNRTFIKKTDALIILLLAAACLAGLWFMKSRSRPGTRANYAVLTVNDEIQAAWPLDGSLDGQVIDLAPYAFPGKAETKSAKAPATSAGSLNPLSACPTGRLF